jgi:hypothetical protein
MLIQACKIVRFSALKVIGVGDFGMRQTYGIHPYPCNEVLAVRG